MRRILSWLFALLLVSPLLALLGYTGWLVGDRSLPVEQIDKPLLLTPTVTAGEEVRVRVNFMVHKYCPTHVDTFLFDSRGTLVEQKAFDFETGQAVPGEPAEYVLPIQTPIDLPAGRTTFRALSTYRCNWVQRLWPLHAPPFEIEWVTREVPDSQIQERVSDELKDLLEQLQ